MLPTRLAAALLLAAPLASCAVDSAASPSGPLGQVAAARPAAASEHCQELHSHGTAASVRSERYGTPELAVAGYSQDQGRFDVRGFVPPDGYSVALDGSASTAVLRRRTGDIELDAVRDAGGWYVVRVRGCE